MKTLKRIRLNGSYEILSKREQKNVMGGYDDGSGRLCYKMICYLIGGPSVFIWYGSGPNVCLDMMEFCESHDGVPGGCGGTYCY